MDQNTTLTVPAEARFPPRIAVIGAGPLGMPLSTALTGAAARQRAAIAGRAPEELERFDARAAVIRRPAARRMVTA